MLCCLLKLLYLGNLIAGAAAAYLLWKYRNQSNQIDNPFYEELDIPNSVYNDVKNLAKRKFRERKLILVESVADWESAYQIIAEDLENVKVGYLYKYPQNVRDVVCLIPLTPLNLSVRYSRSHCA